MTRVNAIYLHGFASSPKTAKGVFLGKALRRMVRSYTVPDLQGGPDPEIFLTLTMDGMLRRARAAIAAAGPGPLLVMGSSLGGYLAALLASRRALPRRAALLLIAPAYGFPSLWRHELGPAGIAAWKRRGARHFFHYAVQRELPLGAGFLRSCEKLPDHPALPTGLDEQRRRVCIVHGTRDTTVPWRGSAAVAATHPRVALHLVDDDHRLTSPPSEALLVHLARMLVQHLGDG